MQPLISEFACSGFRYVRVSHQEPGKGDYSLPPDTPHSKFSTVILVLFCAPFCLAGLGIFVWALAAAPMAGQSWMLAAFGLVFAAFGFAPLLLLSRGQKEQSRQEELRARYPDAPWMVREDWAQGRIQSTNQPATIIGAWVFAVLWNLISLPSVYFSREAWSTDLRVLIVFIFPLVGLGLLVRAGRMTLRRKEFGKTWFEMASVPGVLGKELEGRIWAHFDRPPEQGVVLKLTCCNRTVSGSGKNRTTHEEILWREENTVPLGAIQSAPTASAIPVRFELPADGTETNTENPNNSILWILSAAASVPGVDYNDEFEVPVFRTKESPSADSAARMSDSYAPEATLAEVAKAGIRVRPTVSGGTEFYFSAARNPAAAVATTVFFAIWSAMVWFIWTLDAPLIFFLVFGFFDALLLLIVLSQWLGTATLTIASGTVTTRRGIAGLAVTRRIPSSQVTGLKLKIGMQSGGRSGTPYYDIRMVLADGKEHTVASEIRDKDHAEWLLAQMRAAMGLKQTS